MVPPNNLGHDLSGKAINETQYRGMIGSLMYLTSSRPDIQFSTFLCVRYQTDPKESHLIAVKRIFRNYTGCNMDWKSTPGACQSLGGKLVCWSAKKQQFVAMSSAEAKYVADAGCCANILWMKNQLTDYDIIYENEAFTRAPTQYKEYLSEFWCTTKTLPDSKVWVSTPTGGVKGKIGYSGEIGAKGTLKKCYLPPRWRMQVDYAKLIWKDQIHKLNKKTKEKIVPRPSFISILLEHMMPEYNNVELTINPTQGIDKGTKNNSFDHIFLGSNPRVLVDKTKSVGDGLKTAHTNSGANKESRADDISLKVKLEDLSDILKDTRSAFFNHDSPQDAPIIVTDESEEEEADKDDTHTASHDVHLLQSQKEEIEQTKAKAKAEVASLKAKPSFLDINQLTDLLVTFLKPKLSKLLASHDFASCLPTKLKELPLKITRLSREIKEIMQYIRDMEIKLHSDLKEIPTKLETFTSTIFSLSSQVAELENIQWKLPTWFLNFPSQVSSVQEKLKTLDSLPSLLHKVTDTLNRFATMVESSSAGQATTSLAEGEKNIKDVETNLKNE
nr:uncharacterized mitochondrial protein AtMg00810-like [Tanacetum cinerariifolium]